MYWVFFCRNVVIADPTEEEENLANGLITIVTLDAGNMCMQHQSGKKVWNVKFSCN